MDTLNTIIKEALNNAYEDIVLHLDLSPKDFGKGTHSVVSRNKREAHLAIIEKLEELKLLAVKP